MKEYAVVPTKVGLMGCLTDSLTTVLSFFELGGPLHPIGECKSFHYLKLVKHISVIGTMTLLDTEV